MDGGTHFTIVWMLHPIGLSPRGRGNPLGYLPDLHVQGSIPAWAGEPAIRYARYAMSTVYPRVGGGTVRGDSHGGSHNGLSPRGRGNLKRVFDAIIICGSIPAWAGEPHLVSY